MSIQASTCSGRGRGRGRGEEVPMEIDQARRCGRGRGRGRGRGDPVSMEPMELIQSRAQKQVTKRRLAGMPADVRKELLERKRVAGLQRVLLPDAPPRKRIVRKPSPERELCPMMDTVSAAIVGAEGSGPDAVPDVGAEGSAPDAVPDVGAEGSAPDAVPDVGAEGSAPDAVPDVGAEESVPDADAVPELPAMLLTDTGVEPMPDLDFDVVVVGAEAFESPSTSQQQRSNINANDQNFDEAVDSWLQLCDSDEDMDIDVVDNDICPLPTMTSRDAMAEPSCTTDFSTFQAHVLDVEDRLNDAAIRDIAPIDNYLFEFKKDVETFTGQRETFTGVPGPTIPITDQTTVLDMFYAMFDSDFIDMLCTETNRYADQKLILLRREDKLTGNSRINRWTPTNRDEMISYLAILILQALYPQVEEQSYFSFNGFGTMPYFSRIMSYNRFHLLKSLLHFVDNETTDRQDKMWKLKPVIDYFNDKFSSLYTPKQEISIDESLLKWHGRLSFAQKIATKAAQVGVKTYELCESSSGYLWKFFVYAGKKTPTAQTVDDGIQPDLDTTTNDNCDRNEGDRQIDDDPLNELTDNSDGCPTNATAKIVHDLIKPLLHRGHTVIMDNFYNSPLLLRYLKRQKTDCYGTLRLNREFVPDSIKTMTKTDLRQGEIVATYCPDLSIMVWRDANLVSMISTYHRLQIGTQEKYNRVAYKPQIVLDYNKSMGGVDRKDQFLSAQPMERVRNKVWYKKVFQRLYNTALFNCFVIYGTKNPKVSHRQFRRLLAENLLKQHQQIDLTREPRLTFKNKSEGQIVTPQPNNLTRPTVENDHFPVRTTAKTGRRCWMCCRRKKEARTIWKCMECDVFLCIDTCFRAYHKP